MDSFKTDLALAQSNFASMTSTSEAMIHASLTEAQVATKFIEALDKLVDMGAAEGVELKISDRTGNVYLGKLPMAERISLLEGLNEYLLVLETLRENRESIVNNLNSFWLILRMRGLRACPHLFSKLKPTDIIEIYSLTGIQTFRSFHFLKLCSYPLDQLFAVPWYELFLREPAINEQYSALFNEMVEKRITETMAIPVGQHVVAERSSLKRYLHRSTPRWFAPIRNSLGQIECCAHVFSVESVESPLGN